MDLLLQIPTEDPGVMQSSRRHSNTLIVCLSPITYQDQDRAEYYVLKRRNPQADPTLQVAQPPVQTLVI